MLLDVLLAATFVGEPVAAPGSDRIAWTEYRQGTRSIWTAAAPGFEPTRLVGFDGDDGEELSQLAFSPDGAWVYFVRGGGKSAEGKHPNPASLISGTSQLVWRAAVSGGGAQAIAEGSTPVLRPIHGDLAFERDGQWLTLSADAIGMGDSTPRPLFHTRGDISELSWSPNGSAAVFVSARGRYNFIGLYRPDDPAIHWVAPDVSRDRAPAWSPDGKAIAWLRFTGAERSEYFDFSKGSAFAVWTYRLAEGEAREIWRSTGEDGDRNTTLQWADERTLLFDSEQDGWRRSYRLDAATGAYRPITPTECEVFGTATSSRSPLLVVSTNCGEADRRHLARVDSGKEASTPLTAGDGAESAPVFLASGAFLAYLRATAAGPPSIHIMSLADRRAKPLRDAGATPPVDALPAPLSITFPSAAPGGARIHGQLFMSSDARFAGRKRAAIVYLHGGPASQATATWYGSVSEGPLYAFNQHLASLGYLVLAINYRGSSGYGKVYRTTPGIGGHGALEYQDVLGGTRYLQARPDVDAARIGVYGDSYGGNLASMALARNSDVFAAGTSIYGYVDYVQRARDHMPGGGWGLVSAEDERIAYAASPIAYATTWRSPTLFIHGDDDPNVEFSHTVSIVTRLRRQGAQVEVLALPDEAHGFLRHAAWEAALHRAAGFFERHLGGGPAR